MATANTTTTATAAITVSDNSWLQENDIKRRAVPNGKMEHEGGGKRPGSGQGAAERQLAQRLFRSPFPL